MQDPSLQELQKVSERMEHLANQAESDTDAITALVSAISDWVDQVDSFVDRCDDPAILQAYNDATRALDACLAKLNQPGKAAEIEQELPEVVGAWETAVRNLVNSTL